MSYLENMNKIQRIFLTTFIIFVGYHLLAHLPFWPELIWGFDPKKLLKIIAGIFFVVSVIK
ncbi:MAG TPA: hypothetical protein DDY13_03935 [Cytophagales bacterium]|nr:hypothetical protein [Cytophagales bacterium]